MGDWLATGGTPLSPACGRSPRGRTRSSSRCSSGSAVGSDAGGERGLLTNGGLRATLTAVVAARHHAVATTRRAAALTLYASDQGTARCCVPRGSPACRGRRCACCRATRTSASTSARCGGRCARTARGPRAGARRRQRRPTNTGAVDPIDDAAARARGGRVAARRRGVRRLRDAERARVGPLLAGLGRCDSVALDPPSVYVPFECGCLLAREPERLRAAFQISRTTSATSRRARRRQLRD